MPVAVEVGDVWPANRGGSEVVDAVDPGTDIGFFMDQTVDDLLRPASRNEVKADGANLTISMTPAKMSVLMSRTRDCRAAMKATSYNAARYRQPASTDQLDEPPMLWSVVPFVFATWTEIYGSSWLRIEADTTSCRASKNLMDGARPRPDGVRTRFERLRID